MSTFVKGKWKAVCDQCGQDFLSDQLRLQWNNLRTCCGPGTNDCWEPRHPQEFLKGKADRQMPPWVRPVPPEITVGPGDVKPEDL